MKKWCLTCLLSLVKPAPGLEVQISCSVESSFELSLHSLSTTAKKMTKINLIFKCHSYGANDHRLGRTYKQEQAKLCKCLKILQARLEKYLEATILAKTP